MVMTPIECQQLYEALQTEFNSVLTPGAFEALKYFIEDQYT